MMQRCFRDRMVQLAESRSTSATGEIAGRESGAISVRRLAFRGPATEPTIIGIFRNRWKVTQCTRRPPRVVRERKGIGFAIACDHVTTQQRELSKKEANASSCEHELQHQVARVSGQEQEQKGDTSKRDASECPGCFTSC
jgi:hypothetical protein